MAQRGLGEPVLMLSGLRHGLGKRGAPTAVCPSPDLSRRPSVYDKVVPRGPDGAPVYDPDVGYQHDIDMYPKGAAPTAPWMWGSASFGAAFPQAVPKDFPASLMPRLTAVGTQSTWHLGQIGATIAAKAIPVRAPAVVYHPKYSYDVAQIQAELVEHLGPQHWTEFTEHYWASASTNAILQVLPDTIEIEIRDPRTGKFPIVSDKAKTIEITVVAGSAEEFRRLFPAASFAATMPSGTSNDIPSEIDEAVVRGLLEDCSGAGTYGQQLNCMAIKLYDEYGVTGASAEGHALYAAMLRAVDRIHQEDAEASQGIVSFHADSAAEEAAGKTAPPEPLYQPKAAVIVPRGSLVFTETALPEGVEKEEESIASYASKHSWVKPVAIGGGIAVVGIIAAAVLRRRK